MAERGERPNRWLFALAYMALMALLVMGYIMPAEVWPRGIPAPDLLLCTTFLWVLRRPHYLPTLLIAAVFLLADMLFLRPLGLWTALVVLAVEFLRNREAHVRQRTFILEWVLVAAVVTTMTLVYWLVLTVFLVPQTGLGLSLLQLLTTISAYPLVVLAARFVFAVRKMTPAETDAQGRPR